MINKFKFNIPKNGQGVFYRRDFLALGSGAAAFGAGILISNPQNAFAAQAS